MFPPKGPDEIYGELFEAVQLHHVFPDSKTFADASPKADIAFTMAAFEKIDRSSADALAAFVREHFILPTEQDTTDAPTPDVPVRERIEKLWTVLSRAADQVDPNSSLIELPRPYIVPGGRFREIYYWDSYFTMLGLAESGRVDAIEDMVRNFAYLIDTIGFVPNGNRTYFCTRSQPPYFVLMVELLAGLRGDGVWDEYLPRLEREYAYWMDGADTLTNSRDATRRVVKVDDGFLNRYWDDSDRPRQESFAEDREHTAHAERDACEYYRSIRAACESGWDFSSRWLGDADDLVSIRTTSILPVDLNALLYRLESRLARCHSNENPTLASEYEARAAGRLRQLQTRFYDERQGFFFDLQMTDMQSTGVKSLAAAYPLFLGIATPEQAENVVRLVHEQFLAAGGWLTTLYRSGQQWDRPNGWAPLQWLTFDGFCRYGFESEAREGATRWVRDNIDVYERTGRLFEKYDVERIDALATGGEYAVQDGFGWTNGVLLKLMNRLDI